VEITQAGTRRGKCYCLLNNLHQHNILVFDSADANPRRWKQVALVEDPK